MKRLYQQRKSAFLLLILGVILIGTLGGGKSYLYAQDFLATSLTPTDIEKTISETKDKGVEKTTPSTNSKGENKAGDKPQTTPEPSATSSPQPPIRYVLPSATVKVESNNERAPDPTEDIILEKIEERIFFDDYEQTTFSSIPDLLTTEYLDEAKEGYGTDEVSPQMSTNITTQTAKPFGNMGSDDGKSKSYTPSSKSGSGKDLGSDTYDSGSTTNYGTANKDEVGVEETPYWKLKYCPEENEGGIVYWLRINQWVCPETDDGEEKTIYIQEPEGGLTTSFMNQIKAQLPNYVKPRNVYAKEEFKDMIIGQMDGIEMRGGGTENDPLIVYNTQNIQDHQDRGDGEQCDLTTCAAACVSNAYIDGRCVDSKCICRDHNMNTFEIGTENNPARSDIVSKTTSWKNLPYTDTTETSGDETIISEILGVLYSILLPVGIVLGLFLLARAGYMLMTSQGDPGKTREGKEYLTSAIMGLLFVLLSVGILRVIISKLVAGG